MRKEVSDVPLAAALCSLTAPLPSLCQEISVSYPFGKQLPPPSQAKSLLGACKGAGGDDTKGAPQRTYRPNTDLLSLLTPPRPQTSAGCFPLSIGCLQRSNRMNVNRSGPKNTLNPPIKVRTGQRCSGKSWQNKDRCSRRPIRRTTLN